MRRRGPRWSRSPRGRTGRAAAPGGGVVALSADTASRASSPAHDEQRLSSRGALMSSLVDADEGAGADVVEHEVPGEDGRRVDVELGGDERREGPRGDVAEPPDGAEVLLGVEEQPLGGDLPVEVDRQLRNATDRSIDEEQALLEPARTPHDDPPGEPQVPVEPGVEQRAAVDLDGQLATACPPGVGVGLDPQVGAVGVGADDAEAAGGGVAGAASPRRPGCRRAARSGGPVRRATHPPPRGP